MLNSKQLAFPTTDANDLIHTGLTKLEYAKIEIAKAIAPMIFGAPDWFSEERIDMLNEAATSIAMKLLNS